MYKNFILPYDWRIGSPERNLQKAAQMLNVHTPDFLLARGPRTGLKGKVFCLL